MSETLIRRLTWSGGLSLLALVAYAVVGSKHLYYGLWMPLAAVWLYYLTSVCAARFQAAPDI